MVKQKPRIYFHKGSRSELREYLADLNVREYSDGILVAELDHGRFSRLPRKEISLKNGNHRRILLPNAPTGQLRYQRHFGQLYAFIDVFGHPTYPEGLYITPFNEVTQRYVYGTETREMKTGMKRFEFDRYNPFGDEESTRVDPILDGFKTLDSWLHDGPRAVILTTPKAEAKKEEQMNKLE